MRKETALLLAGITILAILLIVIWWAWWTSPRITTPGCLSAKNAVIVVYTDKQGLLAEHILLRISAEWAAQLPFDTKYCIAHEDDIGIHGLPVYPYIVVRGKPAKILGGILVNKTVNGKYFPVRADLCARLAYDTYSYGGENMPAPRFNWEALFLVADPLPNILVVKKAQLFSELPELSIRAATKIETAKIVKDNYTFPSWSIYPIPILRSKYDLTEFTPSLIKISDNLYTFKRMGWLLYDLGIVRAVGIKKKAVTKNALFNISITKRNITILVIIGNPEQLCSLSSSTQLQHVIRLYDAGKIGLGFAAYEPALNGSSLIMYRDIASRHLDPIHAYNKLITMCSRTSTYTNRVINQSNIVRIKAFELAGQLPLLVFDSEKLSYYIIVKLSDTDIATIDSIINKLSSLSS